MYHIDEAIEDWSKPFHNRHYYSVEDVDELRLHLLDAYDEERTTGSDEAVAFASAVERVGSESLLRKDYQTEWNSKSYARKYLKLLSSEQGGLRTQNRRRIYGLFRLVALVVGVIGAVFAPTQIQRIVEQSGSWSYNPERFFYVQGRLFHFTLVLSAAFNLVPFTMWRFRLSDGLRVIFVGWISLTVIHNIIVFSRHGLGDFDALWWTFLLCVGPLLWIHQSLRRRDPDRPKLKFRIAKACK